VEDWRHVGTIWGDSVWARAATVRVEVVRVWKQEKQAPSGKLLTNSGMKKNVL